MNIYEIFEQTEWWITADRMPIRLVDMDETHRANTLAMLRRRADYTRRNYYWFADKAFSLAPDEVWAEHEQRSALALDTTAEKWLEARPFIIELARLVRKDELDANTVDGEVVEPRKELERADF